MVVGDYFGKDRCGGGIDRDFSKQYVRYRYFGD